MDNSTEANASSPDYDDLALFQAAKSVWFYTPLVLLPLGMVGNILTIWTYSRSSTASSSSSAMGIYFRALAVSDLCLLTLSFPRDWFLYYLNVDIRNLHTVVCKLHYYVVYVFVTTSAWFLVAMTSQRALSVTWPHKMRWMSTRRASCRVVGVITTLSCLLYTHFLYGMEVTSHGDEEYLWCQDRDESYAYFSNLVMPWVGLVLESLLPFLLLLVSNILLMVKVGSSVRTVRQLTMSGSSDQPQDAVNRRRKMVNSLSVTLISVSVMFLLLTLPVCVMIILYYYLRDQILEDVLLWSKMELAWAVTNNLWYANSSLNFYVYCLSGSRFRKQVFGSLFKAKRAQSSPGQSLKTISGSISNTTRSFAS